MTTVPSSERTPVHHPRLAWWAIGTTGAAAVMYAVGLSVLGAVGFQANDEDFDTWQKVVVMGGLFGGMVTSAVAFALAVVEKFRHDRWLLLWIPLLFGPAIIISFPFWFE